MCDFEGALPQQAVEAQRKLLALGTGLSEDQGQIGGLASLVLKGSKE